MAEKQMPDNNSLFTIRSMVPEDQAFVLSSFLKGLYYGFHDKNTGQDSFYGLMPKDVFMNTYSKVAHQMINHPNTLVMIACLSTDPDFIVGFSILSSNLQTVHWVHVKKPERRKGIARRLVPSHPTSVSHLSKLGYLLLPKLNGAIYNPFFTL